MKIIHVTTVHPRSDTRIRIKQTTTLAAALDAEVFLFVQDGLGDELDSSANVQIIDTGPPHSSKTRRMIIGGWQMFQKVKATSPKVVHFHDPELIPYAIALKFLGARIVYDVHEDVPRQILDKRHLPVWVRRILSLSAAGAEWFAGRFFDAFVPATDQIAKRFPTKKTCLIRNFPLVEELALSDAAPYQKRPKHFAYVGGITSIRGSKQMVDALEQIKAEDIILKLAGVFQPSSHQGDITALPGWKHVQFLGWQNREQIADLLGNVRAGLVVLQPTVAYVDALPVKLFEYMAAGLPVIASDFPLWRKIVDGAECGLLVDPKDPAAIAKSMDWILANPAKAAAMGQRGKHAVETSFNWPAEANKLVAFYHEQLGVSLKVQQSQGDE